MVTTDPNTVDDVADEPRERSTLRLLATPGAIVVLVVGLLIRLWIINTARGNLLADEAYTGLQAAEVLDGQFRIVIPGLTYTAPFDSYVLAPFVGLFGQNILVLKLFPSIAWGLASVVTVAVLRRLAPDRAALLAGAMVWLAPGLLAIIATRNYESYASGMLFVTLTAFATVVLLDEVARAGDPAASGRHLAWRSAAVGALAGFTFYLHPMYVAVLLPMVCVPAWILRRRVRDWWLPALGGAVIVNLPFLAWNAANSWPSLEQPAAATDGPLDRLIRFATGLAPRAYGLRGLSGDWVFGTLLSVIVGLGLVALAALGAVLLWRRSSWRSLLILAPLTIGWVIMAGFTNTAFVLDGRYAIITFPFVVMTLAVGLDRLLPRQGWATLAALVGWAGIFIVPILVAETGTTILDPNADVRTVIEHLDGEGIDRLSGYYWWVLPVEALSDQRIRTSVVGNPNVILLPDTQRLVESSAPEDTAFLFWSNEEDTSRLRMPIDRYRRTEIGDVVVYTPIG